MSLPEVVEKKLEALPAQPGVYVFLDRKGHVLYVGKARSLRSRVRSYFQPGSSDSRFTESSRPLDTTWNPRGTVTISSLVARALGESWQANQ